MAPLIVLLVSWPVVRLIGFASSWHGADSWSGALRFAFALMFSFTAGSHFHPRTRGEPRGELPGPEQWQHLPRHLDGLRHRIARRRRVPRAEHVIQSPRFARGDLATWRAARRR